MIKRCVLVFVLLLPQWAMALTTEQSNFQQAREALRNNDLDTFNRLYGTLDHYPLQPYLDLWRYWNVLDDARNDGRVERILSLNAEIPEAIDLRARWIKALAKRKQWSLVAQQIKLLPKGKHPDQRIMLLSQWHNGEKKKAVSGYTRYWRLVNTPDPRLSPIAKRWRSQGHPTADDVWAKVERYGKKGRWSQADAAAKVFSESDQAWLTYWQNVRKNPQKYLTAPPKKKIAASRMAMIFDDGLRQLAKHDVVLSWKMFQADVRPLLQAPHDGRLMRHIALRAAYQHKTEAIAWLKELPPAMQTDTTRTWPARLLLVQGQWAQALAEMEALPTRIRAGKEKSRWQYWRARCLAELGQTQQAVAIYRSLATERGYYSFLAAEHLNLDYQVNSRVRVVAPELVAQANRMAGLQRAREWFQLGQQGKARREWASALRGQNRELWYAAMLMAEKWGWSEQALRAASSAGALDHLDVRFPLAYYDDVQAASQRTTLSPSLLWSVIRQESLFNPEARSPVGARGLMQLMPKTARAVAKQNPSVGKRPDLEDPATNILLGSWYLGQAMKRFDGRTPLAVAAYNAGPHRVDQWLRQTPFEQPDVWVEAIPFQETRNYVQRIMAFSIIYDWRQGKPTVSLLKRLKGEV